MTDEESTAEQNPSNPGKWMSPRNIVGIVIAIITAVCLVLAAFSGLNYTEIVKAKALSTVITEDHAIINLDAQGNVESVNMTVDFTIFNPSGKPIRAWIFTYKGWIRDLPFEMGLDEERWRIDGTLTVNDTEQRYYPVFVASYSFDNPSVIVPPESNLTITRHIVLDRARYPDIMAGFLDIYNYSRANGLELEWLHYTSAIMFIHSAPLEEATGNAALIRRFDGVDITQGVGGAGP